jgi:predicted nucleic acid-binding protein
LRIYHGLVVDTGVWIEYFSETTLGKKFKEKILEEDILLFISEPVVSELYYVICRQKGHEEAKKDIEAVLEGVEVIEGRDMQILAGKYKCERAISLSDCFTISVSKNLSLPALFKKEKEIDYEINKKLFDIEILFLEDI